MSHHAHYAHHHHGKRENHSHGHPALTRASGGTGIKDYGVWVGTPISFTAQTLEQDKSPHIDLKYDDGSGQDKTSAINVASTGSDTNLVYWLNRQFNNPITKTLTGLSEGFHQATENAGTGISLDYVRTTPKLLDFSQGTILQDSDSSKSNDILSQLEPILNDALQAKATIYLFGSSCKQTDERKG